MVAMASCIRSKSRDASSELDSGMITANSSLHAAADVHRPDLVAEPLRDLREHGVAGEVTDPVVDRLEVVEIEDQEREPPVVALGAQRLPAQGLVEVALVEEAGQGVVSANRRASR